MAIERIDESLCDGCGICVDNCPMDVIRINEKKGKAYVAYPADCGVCFQCVTDCPVGAVSVSCQAPKELVLPY